MRRPLMPMLLAIVVVGCGLGSPGTPTPQPAPGSTSSAGGTGPTVALPASPTATASVEPTSAATPLATPTSASTASLAPPASLGPPFGPDDVVATVDLLAAAGVTVRVRPGEPPLVPVVTPSRVTLLRFQARNLALEAAVGGGTLGSDLDGLIAGPRELPLSYLVAGWARVARTPAATAARRLIARLDTVPPPELTIPGLVLFLWLADVAGPAPAGRAGGGARLAVAVAGQDDFCGEIAAYLTAALEGTLEGGASLSADWLQAAIDLYAGVLRDDPAALRRAVGAMALLAYATSVARGWTTFMVASPGEWHHRVGDGDDLSAGETEFRLAVDPGPAAVAEEAAECASLAGIELGETELEGTPVGWVPGDLLAHITEVEGDLELDERGNATYGFEPVSETEEAHREGTLQRGRFILHAVIRRQDIARVEEVVRSLVTGAGLGVAGGAAAAAYDALRPKLQQVMLPKASATVEVSWHAPKEEQKAVWVVVDRPAQPPLTAGRTLELVSCDGPYGAWSGYIALGGLSADQLRIPLQPLPLSFSFQGREGVQRTRTRVAGSIDAVVFTMNVDYDFEVRNDGRSLSLEGQGRSDTSVGFGIGGPVSLPDLPIQPAPEGMCPGG